MKKLLNIHIFMLALLVALPAASKEEIGVASAVNKNTTVPPTQNNKAINK